MLYVQYLFQPNESQVGLYVLRLSISVFLLLAYSTPMCTYFLTVPVLTAVELILIPLVSLPENPKDAFARSLPNSRPVENEDVYDALTVTVTLLPPST